MDMVLNDSTDHSTFSNTSGNPEDSAERCDMEDPMMEVSNGPDEKFESKPPSMANPDAAAPGAAPTILIPSMRGTMTYAGGSITCKGKWAMSDANHSVSGHTSDFEFKLVKKDENCMKIFPVDGMYQGWFMLKQAPPSKGSIKVEDKEMELHFQPDDENNHKITGHGSNKFGQFNLYGTLSDQGAVHIYREYFQLNPLSATTPVAKKPVGRPEGTQRRPSIGVDPAETPRESSGRIRKQSSVLKDYQDLQVKHATPRATPRESLDGGFEAASSSSLQRQSSVERSHRLAPAMRKCSDLLREMSKLPQARWFLEPVDPIKLQIPDYPKIIKTPMDFSTIRANIEGGVYETIDSFAEDMRLVFRNAITFNAARDNIVNINAREVSAKFEDRFRMILSQMESTSYALLPPEPKMSRTASSSSFAGSASKGANGNKKRASMGSTPRSSVPGPRQPFPFVPPAAVDGNLTQMLALQRQMEDMKAELDRLRHVVQEKDVAKSLRETKDAAQNPLTMEEKRQLVQMVSRLSPDKMDRLVEIIRDGLPDDKKDDEITEVPLDILDTLTLRRLQTYVKDNVSSVKKRPAPGSTIPRARSEPSLKKSKKSVGGTEFVGAAAGGATEHDIDLFDHEDLLTERFEDNVAESTGLALNESPGLPPANTSTNVAAPSDTVSLSGYDSAQGGDRDEDQSDWATLGS